MSDRSYVATLFVILAMCAAGVFTPRCSGAQGPQPDALLVAAKPYCIAAAAAEGFDPKLCDLPEKLRPFVEDALRQRLAARAGAAASVPCSEPAPAPLPPVPANETPGVGVGGSK